MNKKRLSAYLLLTFTAIIWGIAGPVIKGTLAYLPPFTFLFWRFLIASLILLPLLIWRAKKENETLKTLLPIIPLGFLGVPLCLALIYLGFERTTALDGTIIAALAPIFIVISGVLFLREKVTRLETLGLLIAIAGTTMIIIQPLLEGGLPAQAGALASRNILGNLFIMIQNLVWTAYVILSKKEFRKHSPLIITAVSFITGLVIILPFALLESNFQITNFQPLITNHSALLGVLYMALLSSVVAYFTFESGLKLIEASEATIFSYLQPIFAAPVAILWLGEKITPTFLLGAIIIALGVFLTEFRPRRLASAKEKG
jgi:drug/metabolite transporter (DMT)-like permease